MNHYLPPLLNHGLEGLHGFHGFGIALITRIWDCSDYTDLGLDGLHGLFTFDFSGVS